MTLNTISRFGRSFSVVSIPYSLKLLMQELQAINVHMRIITEDNIDQIESMSYSNNIRKLTLDPEMTPKMLADQLKKQLKTSDRAVNTPESIATNSPESIDEVKASFPGKVYAAESPAYSQGSPAYASDSPHYASDSPPYAQGSPAYAADSPAYAADSPPYAQGSPAYAQGSPAYAAESPAYAADSPAYKPSYTGGKRNGSINDFTLEDEVYYRNSTDYNIAPDQVWKIAKKGQSLLTIQCPPEFVSSANHGEYIQMAKPSELIHVNSPEGVQFRKLNKQRMESSPVAPTINPNYKPANQDCAPPGIHFTPVITITTGDNNTVTPTQEPVPAGQQASPGTNAQASAQPSHETAAAFSEFMAPAAEKPKKEKSADKEEGSSSFGGALASFGKLVINKLT
jgi:hypothetical protein